MRYEWHKIDFRAEVIEYRESLTTTSARPAKIDINKAKSIDFSFRV